MLCFQKRILPIYNGSEMQNTSLAGEEGPGSLSPGDGSCHWGVLCSLTLFLASAVCEPACNNAQLRWSGRRLSQKLTGGL